MKQSDYTYNSLPNDLALKIASSLEVPDLSSLGCCSRFWRELCGSDCLWESVFKERWPLLYEAVLKDPNFEGWKGSYIKQHKEMADRAASAVKFLEQRSLSESLEVIDYLRAIEVLRSVQFGFKDVEMFLFKPKLNVLLNLVGLHYCLNCLQVPPCISHFCCWDNGASVCFQWASHVKESLQSSKISDRQVCVKWWMLGRWFYGFRMQDESHSRCVSLEDLATSKDDEVLEVLDRGAIHQVLRVQISFANSTNNL